jgi:hypothetical protein
VGCGHFDNSHGGAVVFQASVITSSRSGMIMNLKHMPRRGPTRQSRIHTARH